MALRRALEELEEAVEPPAMPKPQPPTEELLVIHSHLHGLVALSADGDEDDADVQAAVSRTMEAVMPGASRFMPPPVPTLPIQACCNTTASKESHRQSTSMNTAERMAASPAAALRAQRTEVTNFILSNRTARSNRSHVSFDGGATTRTARDEAAVVRV